jgi:TetR/AcrR family transcriptional regulator, fatty acid metabolism regulator protein
MAEKQQKREQILTAAEKLLSQNGHGTKISDIAREAGVFDSNIYHYFKNKEDLMFSVVEERNRQSVDDLKLQLQGIRDPISKISKLIWWQLYRHDTQKEFSSIVLFQCRSRAGFYTHQAYEQFSNIRKIHDAIIDEGIASGVFLPGINKAGVWSIIFGLTDLEAIMSLSLQETENAHTDLEGIMDLILPMMTNPEPVADKKLDKLNRIRRSAERLFAMKGYENTTIQEIAGLAEVADGTIYDYFDNKEDLLFSSLRDGFQFSEAPNRFNDHLFATESDLQLRTPLQKIRRFIRYFFYLARIRPDFAKTFVLNGIYNHRFYRSKSFSAFKTYIERLYPLLDEGKKAGTIREGVNNRIFRNLVVGCFSINALRWFLYPPGRQLDKNREIVTVINMLMQTLSKNTVY